MSNPKALEPRRFHLTQRDLAVIHFVTQHRTVALDQLATRFFGKNPQTGAVNTNAARACERRVMMLSEHGYLVVDLATIGKVRRRVARPGPTSLKETGASRARRSVDPRKSAHHIRTIDAIDQLDEALRIAGGRVVSMTMEGDIRAKAQHGRYLRKGDGLETSPDAEVVIELRSTQGFLRGVIAVEYVTSKYSDADIKKKLHAFRWYSDIIWAADRASTAKRVERLTKMPCQVLK